MQAHLETQDGLVHDSKANAIKTDLVGEEADAQLFVDHKGKDTHLGGTSVVELDGTLLKLGLFIEGVPAEVDGIITEVTNEFAVAGQVTHDRGLEDSNKEEELDKSTSGDGREGGKSVGDVSEGGTREVDVSRKTDTGLSNEVSDNSKHGDTSVLELHKSEAVELLLVTIGDKSEGIEESERSLGTELVFEGHVGGDRSAGTLLGRGESSGRGDEGGGDNRLHDWMCLLIDRFKIIVNSL